MTRPLLVRRHRGGGNRHGQKYVQDGAPARRNDGVRSEEFAACSLFSPNLLIVREFSYREGKVRGEFSNAVALSTVCRM